MKISELSFIEIPSHSNSNLKVLINKIAYYECNDDENINDVIKGRTLYDVEFDELSELFSNISYHDRFVFLSRKPSSNNRIILEIDLTDLNHIYLRELSNGDIIYKGDITKDSIISYLNLPVLSEQKNVKKKR